MFTIIVAYDQNRGIGKDGKLPWHLPEDLKLFKERTVGHAVVMGKKTWFSIPEKFRPLSNRTNIVVSTTMSLDENYVLADSPKLALEYSRWICLKKQVYLIGGALLYKSALDEGLVSKVIATEVKGVYDVDTYFPELTGNWKMTGFQEHQHFNIVEYSHG